MCKEHMPVTERRRGSKWVADKKRPPKGPRKGIIGWFCNPLVLRLVIASARIIYELLRIFFPRH